MPVEIIDIFDDDEETDWDLMWRESDEEHVSAEKSVASTVREEAGKKGEEALQWLLRFLLCFLTAWGPATASASAAVGRR